MGKFKLRWCQYSPNTVMGTHCREKEVIFYENGLDKVWESEVFHEAISQYKYPRPHDSSCGLKKQPRLFSILETEYNINVRERL